MASSKALSGACWLLGWLADGMGPLGGVGTGVGTGVDVAVGAAVGAGVGVAWGAGVGAGEGAGVLYRVVATSHPPHVVTSMQSPGVHVAQLRRQQRPPERDVPVPVVSQSPPSGQYATVLQSLSASHSCSQVARLCPEP